MRCRTIGAAIVTSCFALAQTPEPSTVDRVFQLTQNETARDLAELATTIRAVVGIRQVSTNDLTRTVSIAGTAAEVAMAEWLIHTLDVPAPTSYSQQFVSPAKSNDVARVYFTHAATPQSLQEIVTTVRSVSDLQRVFVYNSLHAAILRGGAPEIGLADWLMLKLDQPGQNQAPPEYPFAGLRGPEVARVFYLQHAQSPRDIQELMTTLRSIADLQRMFVYIAPKAVAVRAPADRVALAQWLVSELDRPCDEPPAGTHRYELPVGPDNQVRIFYLSPSATLEQRQQIASNVRTTAYVQRLFLYNPLAALSVRGTVGQIATAERLLDELKQPAR